MNKKAYGNESITALKGADRVRKRPSVIFGSDGLTGCQHAVFEIISNSIDEAREGFGNHIEITRHTGGVITVKDYGRGMPVDYNLIEEKYNWELLFCELYAGGKFANNEEENYTYSLGLNGLGLCATQYSAEFMDVSIMRDGFHYILHFKKGENVGGLQKVELPEDQAHITGSTTTWRPDKEVFTDIDIPLSYFQETIKRQAIVNAGLTFLLTDEESGETFTYCYNNGLGDYIQELAGDKYLTMPHKISHETRGKDREDKPEYKLKFEMAFCFSNNTSKLEYYHNSSYLEYGGSPDKAVRSAFISAIDGFLKSNNVYKKDEKKIIFTDIEDSLIFISSSFSTITSYENQTKKAITNKFIQEAMTDFLKKQLEVYFIENKADAMTLAAQVIVNKRSREQAEKTRTTLRKKLTGTLDLNNRVEKFVNCRTKDVTRRELYIVEGDSALGSCKLGRDAEFQAIMPVRGKILNCLKADYDKIFNNDIITDLMRVLGCGVEIKTKHNKDLNDFDINQLRWNRIIICTDADYDGFQIRTLILTMVYRLVPSLIDAGKVFIAESPLYEITAGKKTLFAYSESEKAKFLSKLNNDKNKVRIQRSKGLGENEPEMMWQTTMNPETRRLIQVISDDVAKTQEMFEVLLGDNIKGRKEFIEDFGHLYIDTAAV
ncbi:MAG: toprim domain-containing protein [Defluviitaleaceae bacterium]|nr:toprim domain-containing protein [Defluviitaleaceae bacterium]